MHAGALRGSAWVERFSASYCASWRQEDLPSSRGAAVKLRERLSELQRSTNRSAILVHADALEDGIGARVKKGVELVAAALRVGFALGALGGGFALRGAQDEVPRSTKEGFVSGLLQFGGGAPPLRRCPSSFP